MGVVDDEDAAGVEDLCADGDAVGPDPAVNEDKVITFVFVKGCGDVVAVATRAKGEGFAGDPDAAPPGGQFETPFEPFGVVFDAVNHGIGEQAGEEQGASARSPFPDAMDGAGAFRQEADEGRRIGGAATAVGKPGDEPGFGALDEAQVGVLGAAAAGPEKGRPVRKRPGVNASGIALVLEPGVDVVCDFQAGAAFAVGARGEDDVRPTGAGKRLLTVPEDSVRR